MNDKRVHERHIQKPQKQSLVVLACFVAKLHAVTLQPELIMDVDSTHPAVVVANKLWSRHRRHFSVDASH